MNMGRDAVCIHDPAALMEFGRGLIKERPFLTVGAEGIFNQ